MCCTYCRHALSNNNTIWEVLRHHFRQKRKSEAGDRSDFFSCRPQSARFSTMNAAIREQGLSAKNDGGGMSLLTRNEDDDNVRVSIVGGVHHYDYRPADAVQQSDESESDSGLTPPTDRSDAQNPQAQARLSCYSAEQQLLQQQQHVEKLASPITVCISPPFVYE